MFYYSSPCFANPVQSSPVYILSDAETITELCLNLLHVIGATGVTKNE